MAIHSSILAWKVTWTEEPGGLQSMGSQRVGHDGAHTDNDGIGCIWCPGWQEAGGRLCRRCLGREAGGQRGWSRRDASPTICRAAVRRCKERHSEEQHQGMKEPWVLKTSEILGQNSMISRTGKMVVGLGNAVLRHPNSTPSGPCCGPWKAQQARGNELLDDTGH